MTENHGSLIFNGEIQAVRRISDRGSNPLLTLSIFIHIKQNAQLSFATGPLTITSTKRHILLSGHVNPCDHCIGEVLILISYHSSAENK